MADPLTIATATLAVAGQCIKGLNTLQGYFDGFRHIEPNIRQLAVECNNVQIAISIIQGLYQQPSTLPDSLVNHHDDICIALANTERQLNIIIGKLEPMLQLTRESKTDKLKIGKRISLAWNRNEMESLRQQIQNQTNALQLLLSALHHHRLDQVHNILTSPDWKDRLGKSSRDTENLRPIYDKSSTLIITRSVHPGTGNDGGEDESVIGDETFSFDDAVIDSKAYRRNYIRMKQISGAQASSSSSSPLPPVQDPAATSSSSMSSSLSKMLQKAGLGRSKSPAPSSSSKTTTPQTSNNPLSPPAPPSADPTIIESYEELLPEDLEDNIDDNEGEPDGVAGFPTLDQIQSIQDKAYTWALMRRNLLTKKDAHGRYMDEGAVATAKKADGILRGMRADVNMMMEERRRWAKSKAARGKKTSQQHQRGTQPAMDEGMLLGVIHKQLEDAQWQDR